MPLRLPGGRVHQGDSNPMNPINPSSKHDIQTEFEPLDARPETRFNMCLRTILMNCSWPGQSSFVPHLNDRPSSPLIREDKASRDIVGWDVPLSDEGAWSVPVECEAAAPVA